MVFTWLFQSTETCACHFTANTGQALGGELDKAATDAGYAGGGPFSLKWTFLAGTWVYINLVFNQSSAYIGGEVRRASRLQLWAMPIAAIVTTGALLLLLGLADKVVGLDTFGKIAATGLPFTSVAAQGVGSTFLAALILALFIPWSYTWLPGQILNASRNFLAYSVDGLMPRKLGEVNPRTHTPIYSLLLVGAGSIGALWLFTHWDAFAALVGIFGFILGFGIVSIAAIAFPYRLPEIFESSDRREALDEDPELRDLRQRARHLLRREGSAAVARPGREPAVQGDPGRVDRPRAPLLRRRHPRLGEVLAEVPERRRLLRGGRARARRGPDR